MQTTWEVLERAAERIERDGFWQDIDGEHNVNSVCMILALDCPREKIAEFAAQDAIMCALSINDNLAAVYAWNDSHTAAEVIAMLRAVAASEKARAQQTEPARESVPA